LPFESIRRHAFILRLDKNLLDGRLDFRRPGAGNAVIDRDYAESDEGQAQFVYNAYQCLPAVFDDFLIAREKHHTHAIPACSRELKTKAGTLLRIKLMRYLQEHSRAVSGFRIAAASTAVFHIFQH